MSFYSWGPYVSVAQKKRNAEQKLAQMQKKGHRYSPVRIEGTTIARSFWGKSWCTNLERYSDFASRLPRGRSYVRNSAVLNLEIARGEVRALVAGSELYKVTIKIKPVPTPSWKAICRDCTGGIDSLVELLQGRLSKSVMERVCRTGNGLFPAPAEIELSCSCPDWADMCKHVAAAFYGVGARLDEQPEALFLLRGVDAQELFAGSDQGFDARVGAVHSAKVLAGGDLGQMFGLEMTEAAATPLAKAGATPATARAKKPQRKPPAIKRTAARKKKKPARKARATAAPIKPAKPAERARKTA